MISSPKRAVRCALLGMNASASYIYEYCITHYPDSPYALADSMEDAQLLLIDVDSPEGQYIAAHQHLVGGASGKVPVILSANQTHTGSALFLHKPASPETLREILDRAAAKINRGNSSGNKAGRHILGATLTMKEKGSSFNRYKFGSDDNSNEEIFFDPDQYLYGLILQAVQVSKAKDRVVELRGSMQSFIRICAHSKRVHTTVHSLVLRSAVTTTGAFTMAVLDEEIGRNWFDGHNTESLDSFLWRLAALISRGRLPQDTDPNARMRLRYWPNMTRLTPIPNAMRIASLWSSDTCTMASIAERLTISPGDVHVFYCAASAIGLIEIEVPAPEKATLTAQADRIAPKVSNAAQQSKRGILSRILSHLMGTN